MQVAAAIAVGPAMVSADTYAGGLYMTTSISRWATQLFRNGTNSRPRRASPESAQRVGPRVAANRHTKVVAGG